MPIVHADWLRRQVRFFGFSVQPTPGSSKRASFYMISEYCAGGTIHEAIQVPGVPLMQMVVWALQICETMDHLHSQEPPVVHLDLKPENGDQAEGTARV